MDSLRTDRRPARWWLLAGLTLPALAWTAALPGCADPCLDDGLGQQFCPEIDTEAMSGSGTTSPTTTTGESGESSGCAALDVILVPQTPTVVLLVDQSGSMTEALGNSGTRWEVITDVLANTIVPQFGGDIRLGLTLYTSTDEDAMNGLCPTLTQVDPALDNINPITAELMNANPIEDTPTGESLAIVGQQLDAFSEPGRKYIVLATDGLPDTCQVPDPMDMQEQDAANAETVAEADAAFALGIETFVISVGDDVGAAHLQEMANAGQGVQPGDPDATYYEALEQAELVTAFDDILASVRSCELTLDTPLTADDAANCVLELNGEAVPFDDPNGWQLNGSDEVELVGDACATLQSGVSSVQMECSCG